ncbi:hypothetical protein B0J15DRAFT_467749 [Fusarium solani]|uniref:HNH nuclease domain-containing protein n=1 Tax=Fusarium solani TaxID=169388 RepID=A0A9P9H2C1_FUSSL|nr:uncharacterized protein B0J15DRAFT_467749 [Fusarium solani]KAH7249197.1 hypothetical protein B0J15DRAFT_467749 [Fusarium solani]
MGSCQHVIESEIRANPRTANFKLNAVQVATILSVPLSALRPGGYLSSRVLSGEVHQRLVGLPSLVKHFLKQLVPFKGPEHPEERKCSERDENVCILTGTSKPWVDHIVPFAWNDTLANIQKTEKVFQHIQAFFGKDWLLRYRPYLLNPQQLGGSDKVWNMLCINLSNSC